MGKMVYTVFRLNTRLEGLRKTYLMFLERSADCVKDIQSVVKKGVARE
jgi:hypothetical protein